MWWLSSPTAPPPPPLLELHSTPVPEATSLSLSLVEILGGVAFGLALLAVLGRPLRGAENTESTRRRLLFLGAVRRVLCGGGGKKQARAAPPSDAAEWKVREYLGLPEITRDYPSRDCIGSLPRPLPSAPLCAPLLPSAAPHAGGFTVYRRRTVSPTAIGGTPRRPASPCSSHAARRAGWIGNRSQRIRVSAQVRGDTGDWRGLELGVRTGGGRGSEPGTNIASWSCSWEQG